MVGTADSVLIKELYVVGTADSVLIKEVSLIWSVLCREVPLYMEVERKLDILCSNFNPFPTLTLVKLSVCSCSACKHRFMRTWFHSARHSM